MQLEHNEIRDGIADKDQGLSDEGESHTNGDVDDVSEKHMEVVQLHVHAQTVMQRQQEKPQMPSVSWKRFLPYPYLKVLLVENDNSTRHVVNALLRNCGYEVTAVENGQQAWRILQDLTNHINLVLTEVVMPRLSGIGLLCKIMNHKTCKNIPVIMMSSHDSINIVFKCLSKGAVDFLVKPIRKNELKNLWQHVWRKCHSSSGSGSESYVRTQDSTKSKDAEDSDDNTSCNDGADIGSTGLNVRDGSDNGSGTQSFWVKGTVEVESPKPMSPWDQSADPPDSTCAQVIHLTPEAFDDKWVPVTTEKECEEQDEEPENVPLGKDLEIGVPRISNVHLEGPNREVAVNMVGNNKEILPERNQKKEAAEQKHEGRVEPINKKPDENLTNMANDVLGVVSNNSYPQIDTNIPKFLTDVSNKKDKFINGTKKMPSLKLSLKRHQDTGDSGIVAPDHNGLRHSDVSAFARYNSSSTANQVPVANVGSCSPLDCSSDAAKESNSNNTPPNQRSNGSNNNNDMGSTNNDGFSKPALFSDKPAAKPTAQHLQSYSAFQPVQYDPLSFPQPAVQHNKSEAVASNTKWSHARGNMKQQQVQVQHHHHHYHHHHHHVHNMQQQQQQQQQQQLQQQEPANPDDMNLKNMAAAARQCGSSNLLSMPIDGDGSNQNLNGSASGSDHGSNNAQNGSSSAVNPRAVDVESDNGIGEKWGTSLVGVENRMRLDKSCLAQREAALNKYRQKRKERCFEKKVRYQSRKKLAEQRPRVRGQFVRQAAQENNEKQGCS